jgi:hypothetical protein
MSLPMVSSLNLGLNLIRRTDCQWLKWDGIWKTLLQVILLQVQIVTSPVSWPTQIACKSLILNGKNLTAVAEATLSLGSSLCSSPIEWSIERGPDQIFTACCFSLDAVANNELSWLKDIPQIILEWASFNLVSKVKSQPSPRLNKAHCRSREQESKY